MNTPVVFHLLIQYRYEMLAVLAFFEGSFVCLATGFLTHMRYFSFLPAFIIIILGDLVPNTLFFFIGRFSNKKATTVKILKRLRVTESHLEIIEHFWTTHTWKTMLFSKSAWSMGLPFFMSAGMTRLSFGKYIWSMFVVAIFQYGIIFWIGYFISYSYSAFAVYNYDLSIFGVVCSVAIILFLFIAIPRYAKRELLK